MRRHRVLLCLLSSLSAACWGAGPSASPRLVVLGFDGLDPARIERGVRAGTLPHFGDLAARGGLHRLEEATPAEAARTWTSFATGAAAADHGVFDSVDRDPATYRTRPGLGSIAPPRLLFHQLVVRAPAYATRRAAPAFWQLAGARGVRSTVVGVPGTFPPEPVPNGRLLAGWPVPDLAGSDGTYQYFSSGPLPGAPPSGAGVLRALAFQARVARTELTGPMPPLAPHAVTLPMTVTWTPEARSVNVEIDGRVERLQEGKWSRWLDLTFRVAPLVRVRGLAQMYLAEGGNAVRLYVGPIQWHPDAPPAPIAAPASLAADLFDRLGPYRTLGWPEASAAVADGVLEPRAFLDDAARAFDDRAQIILSLVDARDWSLLVGVVDTADHVAHVEHALGGQAGAAGAGDAVSAQTATAAFYRRADALIGDVLTRLGPGTDLLVVSAYRLATAQDDVHLNAFLAAEGWLAQASARPAPAPGRPAAWLDLPIAAGVDWGATRAYAVGSGGIYVNLRGREAQGAVAPGAEYTALLADLAARLGSWRDPETGAAVVQRVTVAGVDGAAPPRGPDLQVVFAPGYRASWATVAGQLADRPLAAASGGWRADHASWDGPAVAGLLASTRRPTRTDLRLVDVAATALAHFGVPAPAGLAGTPFF